MDIYRYNDLTARHEKVNRFFLLASDLLFAVLAVYYYLHGREVQLPNHVLYANLSFLVVFVLINTVLYRVKKSTKKLRYFVSVEVFFVYVIYSMTTPASFLGMALMGVIGISIPYFDGKFFNGLFATSTLLYLVCQLIRSSIGVTTADTNGVCQVVMNLAVFVMLQRIGSITKTFSEHSLGAIAAQKAVQDQMVAEMVAISQHVKSESDRSRDMMQSLLDSVRQTAANTQEISRMSGSIADDLDEQSRMTREIQSAISGTQDHSQAMVSIAADSSKQISENHAMMDELRQQSDHITNTNTQVTQAMERLQKKTAEVLSFADTILSVSSQTNLLALNAAVESARAGQAGKGFSVIAGQIRKLAEETRTSAEHISRIVGELRTYEEEVVTLVSTSVAASDKQHGMIRTTAGMIESLEENLHQLIANIQEIDSEITNLSASNNTMVDSISKISDSTEAVSANAEETRNLTDQNLRYANSTSSAINSIQSTASRLEQYI